MLTAAGLRAERAPVNCGEAAGTEGILIGVPFGILDRILGDPYATPSDRHDKEAAVDKAGLVGDAAIAKALFAAADTSAGNSRSFEITSAMTSTAHFRAKASPPRRQGASTAMVSAASPSAIARPAAW